MKNTEKSSRKQLEKKYETHGLNDYKLRSLDDLRIIHGIDVSEISGYQELPDKQRELFNKAIINFFNGWGLDNRLALKPKSINYVYDINYYRSISENEADDVGLEVYILDKDSKSIKRRLHRYIFIKGVKFKDCEKHTTKAYLRFELKDVWYHIMSTTEWY